MNMALVLFPNRSTPSKYNVPEVPEKDLTPEIKALLQSLKTVRASIKSIYRKGKKDRSFMEDKRYKQVSPITKLYYLETSIVERLNKHGIKVQLMPPLA